MGTTTVSVQTAAGGGNTIKSIQRGTVDVTSSGAVGFYTNTATISSVNVSKSVVNVCGEALSQVWVATVCSAYATLTNSTTVTCGTGQLGGAYNARVSFEVIEFN